MHFERQESDLPGIMQQKISRAREKCKQSQLLAMYSTQAKILLTEKKRPLLLITSPKVMPL